MDDALRIPGSAALLGRLVFGYITLVAKLPTLSSKAAYESLDWKFTPRDLVEWARRHSV